MKQDEKKDNEEIWGLVNALYHADKRECIIDNWQCRDYTIKRILMEHFPTPYNPRLFMKAIDLFIECRRRYFKETHDLLKKNGERRKL